MTAYKEECQTVLPGKQNKAKKDQKNSLIQGPERVTKNGHQFDICCRT